MLRLVDHRLGQIHHVPLRRLQRIGSRLAFLAGHVHDGLHARLSLLRRFLQVLLAPPHRVRSDPTGLPHHPAKYAHPVIEQGASARMVDVGLHHRPINVQLPPVRHLALAGQRGDVVKQGLHGRRLDQLGPTDQGGVVGDVFGRDATGLTQHQAIGNEVLGVLEVPAVEVLDDQHVQVDGAMHNLFLDKLHALPDGGKEIDLPQVEPQCR